RLSQHLDRARRRAFAEYGLEPWEFDVLSALRRSGEPYRLSPGQLVSEALVTSGTMTSRVDWVRRRGLVVRYRRSADRPGVHVALTSDGRRAVDGALDALLRYEAEVLAELDDEQARLLAEALRVLTLRFGVEP